ncbi:IclR family transcriptional regulator C-terminal domain-containing protein [Amycolatopsis sp. NPDC051903]|uniref:IclR family transcriptional regulator domain-containing protein n=1 Tax=Amycolatopsis sp. NPDC051903 TaxID=3363936 RepID=UPI0037A9614D
MSSADKEQFVTSLARGLTVLRAFGPEQPEMSLSQVAAATGLSPAAARRFLLTLVELGYLAQVDKRFVLTPRVLELSAGYTRSMNLSSLAQPLLQRVRDETGDSVSLTALAGTDILHVVHVQTDRLMRFAITPGARVPAYVSASGRAILAHQSPSFVDSFLAGTTLAPRTSRTITSPAALRSALADVRRDGYAVVVDELDVGITALGCPVFGGSVIAGVSCSTVSGYLPVDEFIATRLPLLRELAESLGREFERFPALLHSFGM